METTTNPAAHLQLSTLKGNRTVQKCSLKGYVYPWLPGLITNKTHGKCPGMHADIKNKQLFTQRRDKHSQTHTHDNERCNNKVSITVAASLAAAGRCEQ